MTYLFHIHYTIQQNANLTDYDARNRCSQSKNIHFKQQGTQMKIGVVTPFRQVLA